MTREPRMDDDGVDALTGHLDERMEQRARRRAERMRRPAGAEAVAGLVLATVSLMGLGSGQLFGQAVVYHTHDLRGMAAAPALAAVVAAVGGWLGRREGTGAEPSWTRLVAAAAVVVAAVAVVVNVVAFVGLVTASQGGFVGG